MIKRLAYIIIILFSLVISLSASDEIEIERIKKNTTFSYGEFFGDTLNITIQTAERLLVNSIQTSIHIKTEISSYQKRHNNIWIYGKQDSTVVTYVSNMPLIKGLKYIISKRKKNYHVLVYISNDAILQAFAMSRHKITKYIDVAIGFEQKLILDKALKNYFNAYLLARNYGDTLYLFLDGNLYETNPSIVLKNKIESLIKNVKIYTHDLIYDKTLDYLPIECLYLDKPVKSVEIKYYNGVGLDLEKIEDGKALLPIYDSDFKKVIKLTLKLQYYYPEEMKVDPEVENLFSIFGMEKINNEIILNLNEKLVFKPVVSIGNHLIENRVNYPIEITQLARLEQLSDFFRILKQYSYANKISYGNKSDFVDINNHYIALVDKNKMYGIFHYDGIEYTNVINNQVLKDINAKYSDKRKVWLKIL